MFLKRTFRKFFIRDGSHDLYWFLFGLVFLFTFVLIRMPQWIFCLGLGVLTSAIFRYITRDDLFYEEYQNLNTRNNKQKYILSKNIFTFFFLAAFVLILYFISNIGIKLGFIASNNFEFKILFNIITYILAFENIFLTFNYKMLPSYKSGRKRDYSEDLEVGMTNLKSMIPSIILNIILVVLVFKYNINLNFFAGIFILLVSAALFSINNRLIF